MESEKFVVHHAQSSPDPYDDEGFNEESDSDKEDEHSRRKNWSSYASHPSYASGNPAWEKKVEQVHATRRALFYTKEVRPTRKAKREIVDRLCEQKYRLNVRPEREEIRSAKVSQDKIEKFLRRMDASGRGRADRLDKKRAEKDYNARIDKKICPKCGTAQTYDEVVKRKKRCQNCNVKYRSKADWETVRNSFYERMNKRDESPAVPVKRNNGVSRSRAEASLARLTSKREQRPLKAPADKKPESKKRTDEHSFQQFLERNTHAAAKKFGTTRAPSSHIHDLNYTLHCVGKARATPSEFQDELLSRAIPSVPVVDPASTNGGTRRYRDEIKSMREAERHVASRLFQPL